MTCVYLDRDCLDGAYLFNPHYQEKLCRAHARGPLVKARHWEAEDTYYAYPGGRLIPLVEAYRLVDVALCLGCSKPLDNYGFAIAFRGDTRPREPGCHPPTRNFPGCDAYDAGTGPCPPGTSFASHLGEVFKLRQLPAPKRHRAA